LSAALLALVLGTSLGSAMSPLDYPPPYDFESMYPDQKPIPEVSPYDDFSGWMGQNKGSLYGKHLTDVVLPGTHNSGAYWLDNKFDPSGDLSKTLQQIIDIAHMIGINAPYNLIRAWALTQTGTVYQQLMGGIRFLDLRCVWDNSTNAWRTSHMLLGAPIDQIAQDIASFVSTHPTEIVVVQTSHYAGENGNIALQDQLANIFTNRLNGRLFPRQSSSFAGFTIQDMINKGQTVLVTGASDRMMNNPYFWPDYTSFDGKYANSNNLGTMESWNVGQLQQFGGAGEEFQMYFTLTMQGASDVQKGLFTPWWYPNSLKKMNAPANADFDNWVRGQNNKYIMPNLLMADFFEDSTLIQTAIRLNNAYNSCIDQAGMRGPNGCRAQAGQCGNPSIAQQCPLTCGKCRVS